MSSTDPVSRRGFLGGQWRNASQESPSLARSPIRPPWALTESEFISACDGCGKCVTACTEKLLIQTKVLPGGKLPEVVFGQAECTFCKACLEICPTDALTETDQAWDYLANVNQECLSSKGVMCRACGDVCDVRVITFKFAVGGFSNPEINLNECTGCGACLVSCPVNAIDIVRPDKTTSLQSNSL